MACKIIEFLNKTMTLDNNKVGYVSHVGSVCLRPYTLTLCSEILMQSVTVTIFI